VQRVGGDTSKQIDQFYFAKKLRRPQLPIGYLGGRTIIRSARIGQLIAKSGGARTRQSSLDNFDRHSLVHLA
jgi:hypothetical protein